MSTVQDEILKGFYKKLATLPSMPPTTVEALRKVLTSGQKVKADEVVAALAKVSSTDAP